MLLYDYDEMELDRLCEDRLFRQLALDLIEMSVGIENAQKTWECADEATERLEYLVSVQETKLAEDKANGVPESRLKKREEYIKELKEVLETLDGEKAEKLFEEVRSRFNHALAKLNCNRE